MQKAIHIIIAGAILALLGCAASPQRVAPAISVSSLGDTKATALEVCEPRGERDYLNRLRCSDGTKPAYRRIGSVGGRSDLPENLTKEQSAALLEQIISGAPLKPGEPDYHVVDGYELSCPATKRMVYIDMYHCNQPAPAFAPIGFTLSNRL